MKFYISFGQCHAHAIDGITYDRNCLALIEAESKREAYEQAMEIFDAKFHNVYEELPNMSYFPRGVIKI